MARKSSIDRLPKPVKDRLAKLVRDGRMTLDEIIAELQAQFGVAPSRSATGRWAARFGEVMARKREVDSVAEIWVKEFKSNESGKTGRAVGELLRAIAMQAAVVAQTRDEVDPKELALLSRAFNLIESGNKRNAELEREIRQQVREELLAEQKGRLDALGTSGDVPPEILAKVIAAAYAL